MKIKIKIIAFIILLQFFNTYNASLFAQDNDGILLNETTSDNFKKNEKAKEDNFFQWKIDKLSEKFFVRLGINFLTVIILTHLIYFHNNKKRELFFTYFIFNFVIFLITFFLNKVDMGLGVAFGLFAVFSMLRYRTESISAKDMTYLFLVIAIGLITAVSKTSAVELGIVNGLILLITALLEGGFFLKKESSKLIQYENIEMIKPENHEALISDLRKRTGLNIHRFELDKVDFLKDTVLIKLYYYEGKSMVQLADSSAV